MLDALIRLFAWPLRKTMAIALDHPRLLAKVSLLFSKFPSLFDWLVEFAQRNGIVVSSEEDEELEKIQSASDLTPEAFEIFEEISRAFQDKANSKP